MSAFLAANDEALRQTTTIQGKIQEEKKQREFDYSSKSLISEIKRSHSRPITPNKQSNAIPFIEEGLMKSPMRTRNRIPRTPITGRTAEEGNDFKNDDNSQLDISIGASQNLAGQLAPQFGNPQHQEQKSIRVSKEEVKKNVKKTSKKAFYPGDKIPRTPPHLKSKEYQKPPPEEKVPTFRTKNNLKEMKNKTKN